MIHNVIEFGETTVAEIMTPKIDMFTLKADDKMEIILPKIIENFYSRVPVYDRGGETIIGFLFTKDLNRFRHLPSEKFNLKSVVRSPVFVPKSKKIKELLEEFNHVGPGTLATDIKDVDSFMKLSTCGGDISRRQRRVVNAVTRIKQGNNNTEGTPAFSAVAKLLKLDQKCLDMYSVTIA